MMEALKMAENKTVVSEPVDNYLGVKVLHH